MKNIGILSLLLSLAPSAFAADTAPRKQKTGGKTIETATQLLNEAQQQADAMKAALGASLPALEVVDQISECKKEFSIPKLIEDIKVNWIPMSGSVRVRLDVGGNANQTKYSALMGELTSRVSRYFLLRQACLAEAEAGKCGNDSGLGACGDTPEGRMVQAAVRRQPEAAKLCEAWQQTAQPFHRFKRSELTKACQLFTREWGSSSFCAQASSEAADKGLFESPHSPDECEDVLHDFREKSMCGQRFCLSRYCEDIRTLYKEDERIVESLVSQCREITGRAEEYKMARASLRGRKEAVALCKSWQHVTPIHDLRFKKPQLDKGCQLFTSQWGSPKFCADAIQQGLLEYGPVQKGMVDRCQRAADPVYKGTTLSPDEKTPRLDSYSLFQKSLAARSSSQCGDSALCHLLWLDPRKPESCEVVETGLRDWYCGLYGTPFFGGIMKNKIQEAQNVRARLMSENSSKARTALNTLSDLLSQVLIIYNSDMARSEEDWKPVLARQKRLAALRGQLAEKLNAVKKGGEGKSAPAKSDAQPLPDGPQKPQTPQ